MARKPPRQPPSREAHSRARTSREIRSHEVREDAARQYRVREAASHATLRGTLVRAADFKANCLALMDEVRDRGSEFVITKHSKPVARLVPVIDAASQPFMGRGAGVFTVRGDIVSPVSPDWEEGADI